MARRIPGTSITECPNCGAEIGGGRGTLQYNARSIWCLGCGWGCNRDNHGRPVSPDGRPIRIGAK
jgi:transposase